MDVGSPLITVGEAGESGEGSAPVAGTEALAEEWERTRAAAPGVVAARSNDWSAFGDGFWVLLDPGPFASADEVRAFCASAGLDGDGECLARELRG